jgi:hypothetical protein
MRDTNAVCDTRAQKLWNMINFWSHVVFMGEAKFRIFGHVSHCQLEQ